MNDREGAENRLRDLIMIVRATPFRRRKKRKEKPQLSYYPKHDQLREIQSQAAEINENHLSILQDVLKLQLAFCTIFLIARNKIAVRGSLKGG